MAVGYVSQEFGRGIGTIGIDVVILDIEVVYKAISLYEITYSEYIKRENEKWIYI